MGEGTKDAAASESVRVAAMGTGARDVPADGESRVGALLEAARRRLERASDSSARLDAELLLAHVTGRARSTLVAFPERGVDTASAQAFDALVARRATGVPVAYLTGRQAFHDIELAVTPAVLVPRPETELIVDEILFRFDRDAAARVLDLGTGSGAIALAVKHARPGFDVTGTDASAAALDVAAANGKRLGLAVRWALSGWLAALGADERYDAIACNPPYVPSRDAHLDGPLRHEPRAALDGGVDGLDAIRAVLEGAPSHLAAGGVLLIEHGYDQREAVRALAADASYVEIAAHDDLAGQPRLVVLERAAP